jgi:putative transposase
MDGRERWMDNVFIERLWRSLKHEEVYLKGYADGSEAKAGIASWIAFYNIRRPHQVLGNRAPMAVWRHGTTGLLAAVAVDMMDNARPALLLRVPRAHSVEELNPNLSGALLTTAPVEN